MTPPPVSAKDRFIVELALFLTQDQEKRFIEAQTGMLPASTRWLKLRQMTPLPDDADLNAAVAVLTRFLS